jgi:hypothetical protein
MSLIVRPVQSRADFEAFYAFPWRLYHDYPHWVPELPHIRRDTLNRQKSAAWEYLQGEYFVAWREGQPVGTLAAFVNPRHNSIHQENIGFFGCYETIADRAVSDALLQAGEDYLRGQGVTAMRGPANFTSNESYGLLVENFEKTPTILMPYNPPYYADYLEAFGFQKAMDLYSWHFEQATVRQNVLESDGRTPTRKVRATQRAIERAGIQVRTFNMRDKQAEFARIRQLYSAAWERNWGFVPLTDRELDELVANLSFLLDPRYTYLATIGGEDVGFMMIIPNFNQVFQAVRPRAYSFLPLVLAKTFWHWKIRPKITSMRIILMGVKAGFRQRGVDAAMCLRLAETFLADTHNQAVEASWVLETNHDLNRLMENFGGYVDCKHRLYQKELGG